MKLKPLYAGSWVGILGLGSLALCSAAGPTTPSPATGSAPRYVVEGHEEIEPARLTPEAEQRALTQALYSEALRINSDAIQANPDTGYSAALPLFQEIIKLDPHFIQAQLRVALCYFQNNEEKKALDHLRSALVQNPDSLELKAALAYAYRLTKNYDDALKLAKEVIAADPEQITAYRVIFEIYNEQGKMDDAMKLVEVTVQQKAIQSDFWVNLAKMYAELLVDEGTQTSKEIAGRLLPIYKRALACGKPNAELLLLLSDCEILMEQNAEAKNYLEQAIKISPPDVELTLRLGNLELAAGHAEAAMKLYEQSYEMQPEFQGLPETLVKLYLSQNMYDKAIAVLEDMVRRDPTQIDLYSELGEVYEKTGQFDKAEMNYQQAVALKPHTPVLYLELALTQLNAHHDAKASQTLEIARKLFPTSARVPFASAIMAREEKKYAQALDFLDQVRALAIGPEADALNETYYLELSTTLELAGKKEAIESTLQEGVKKFPEDESLLNALAYYWAEAGKNLPEALKLSKKSLDISPENSAFLDTLGWLFFKMDQPKEAVAPLEKAVKVTQSDPEIASHLAEVYAKLGRMDEAIALWQGILKAEPDNKLIRARIDSALAESKTLKTAEVAPKQTTAAP